MSDDVAACMQGAAFLEFRKSEYYPPHLAHLLISVPTSCLESHNPAIVANSSPRHETFLRKVASPDPDY